MGTDKALLRYKGEPLAKRTAMTLAAAGCSPVSLVGNQPSLLDLGYPVFREPPGAPHPLNGIAAVFTQHRGLALFVPCDLPHLRPETLRLLLDVGAPCVAEGQPLLCVLDERFAAEALSLARSGGKVRALVSGLPTIAVPPEDLTNVNTPGEFEAAQQPR